MAEASSAIARILAAPSRRISRIGRTCRVPTDACAYHVPRVPCLVNASARRTEQLTAPGTGGDASGGFAKATEMCNNNGHCRKFDAGTMCPSFRVTRDEVHLTRGRANTLRLALTGQLGPEALASELVPQPSDLRPSCNGSKRDSRTGVDMARMKIEVRSARRMAKGLSRRDRL